MARRKTSNTDQEETKAGQDKKHVHFDKEDIKAAEEQDTTHSVLGGLAGGYRIDGGAKNDSSQTETFQIPFGNKAIVCQRYLTPEIRKEDNESVVIFTHGAGGGISNSATVQFAAGFARKKPVLCFQGTMNLQSRIKTFHAVAQDQRVSHMTLGGRSMGARAAVVAAQDYPEAATLLLVSYPLTNAKGTDTRDDILYALDASKSVLFVTGDQDEMCELSKLQETRRKMKARTSLIVVKGADHSMSMRPPDAVEQMRNYTGELAAEWLASHAQQSASTSVCWDPEGKLKSEPWSVAGPAEHGYPGHKKRASSQSPASNSAAKRKKRGK